MKKGFLLLILLMLCAALVPGGAFAGNLYTTPKSVACELLGSGGYEPEGCPADIYYQPSVTIGPGAYVVFTLTNAKFEANEDVTICVSDTVVAEGLVGGSNSSSVTLTVTPNTAGLQVNGVFKLTSTDTPGTCEGDTVSIVINGGLTNQTVTISAQAGPNINDAAGPADLYTVKCQLSATINPVISQLDFLNCTKQFVPEGSAPGPFTTEYQSNAELIITYEETDCSLPITYEANCQSHLSSDDTVTITISGTDNPFQGIAYIDYDSITQTVPSPTATSVSIAVPGDELKMCKNTDTPKTGQTLSLHADGSTAINPGTRSSQVVFANNIIENLVGPTLSHTFVYNATQAVVPYLSTNVDLPSYCVINNTSTTEAMMTLDILSSANGYVVSSIDLGSLAGQHTLMVIFQNDKAIIGSPAGPQVDLGLTGDNTRYAARFNINAPANQVFLDCLQNDPTGPKRHVPVYTVEENPKIPWKN